MAQQARPKVIGHNEPCLAQLAIWSRVVRAYCIAPCFFSCDGRGTSRRIPPVTGRREPSCVAVATGSTEVAALGCDVDIDAAGAARMRVFGRTEVAVGSVSFTTGGNCDGLDRLRSARGATDLDRDNMTATSCSERGGWMRGGKDGRVERIVETNSSSCSNIEVNDLIVGCDNWVTPIGRSPNLKITTNHHPITYTILCDSLHALNGCMMATPAIACIGVIGKYVCQLSESTFALQES